MTIFTKQRVSGIPKAKSKTFRHPDDPNLLGKKSLLKRNNKLLACFLKVDIQLTTVKKHCWKISEFKRGKIWVCKCHSQYISLKILKFRLWEQNDRFWRSIIQFHCTEVNSSKVTYSYSNCFLEINLPLVFFSCLLKRAIPFKLN